MVRYSPGAPSTTAEVPSILEEIGLWLAMVVSALAGLAFFYAAFHGGAGVKGAA
jgi:hypothetical protein